jgi:phosphatidate phosphatase APP1
MGQPHIRTLGPSNANGISSQIVLTGGGEAANGTAVKITSVNDLFPDLAAHTRFAGPDGWAVISDIDDTIKVTHTTDPVGTLRTTFVEIPQTTEGLPEFYKVLDEQFKPTWFYLSASPYNLYPFIHKFIRDNYKPGTIILRDSSWMVLGGLLKSLTQGTQAYKADRMNKIHDWLPNRKFICVGDSTQSDPEAYAEMYKKFPGWIRAM